MKKSCMILVVLAVLCVGIDGVQRTSAAENAGIMPLWHNVDHETTEDLLFRPYELGSNEGTIIVDGRITTDDGLGFPSFRLDLPGLDADRSVPLTAWIKDDGNHLYIACTLSLGRGTMGAGEQPSLYIRQPEGMREYRLKDAMPEFGMYGSFEIPQTKRTHGVIEFKIPLGDIRAPSGSIELAFASRDHGTS